MQAVAVEMAKKIAEELMSTQVKLFQDEMKKMQDEMSKLKEELSKKVDDAISGKNDISDKNKVNKDAASDIGAGEHAHGKGIYSHMSFDYGQIMKGSTLHTLVFLHGLISPMSPPAARGLAAYYADL